IRRQGQMPSIMSSESLLVTGTANVAGTNRGVLATVVDQQYNRGYLVTARMESTEVVDTYNKIIAKYKPISGQDKIVIKYQTIDNNLPDKVWQSTSTVTQFATGSQFTTTEDLSDVEVGDEVEFL